MLIAIFFKLLLKILSLAFNQEMIVEAQHHYENQIRHFFANNFKICYFTNLFIKVSIKRLVSALFIDRVYWIKTRLRKKVTR